MSPVFDENGVMYSNKCKMQAAKCKQTKNGNTSPAPTNDATSSEGSFSDENSVPSDSFCPDACLAVMKPVYDVNGVMYTNECKMRAAKCKKKKFATVVQTPGEGSGSDEDNSISNKKSTRTKCTTTCPDIEKKKFATVVQTPGEGSESDEDNPISNKKSTRTKCTATCPDIILPVCGSDGVKYSNPCQLELVNCKYPELNIVEDVDACSSSTK
ncbi:Epi6-like protease inhibitor [Phytophthora megakarya]|uniref:Epi6-like protease inhibitor n=1 Tax=Phytophthora megakarya TaxID=4795 RepID=A0A225WZW0_9STRA|nr:Epi6-like protease inhibitor [Phytophthora megakarya]